MKVEASRTQLLPNAGKCWSIVFDKSNTWIVCGTYKGNKGYMPMVGHIAQTGQMLPQTLEQAMFRQIPTILALYSPPSCWLSTKVLMKVEALRTQLLPNAGKCWSIVFDKSNTWIVCASVISPMREVKSSKKPKTLKKCLCWIYRKEFTLPGDVQDLKSAVNFLPIYPNPKIKTKKTTTSSRHSPPSCWLSTKVLMKVEALRTQLLSNAGKCWSIVFDKSNTWIVCAGVISPMREVKSSLVVSSL
jgi:hypothetical protein